MKAGARAPAGTFAKRAGLRTIATAVAAVLLATASPVASADVYGFVDDVGQLHLATEPLDARYKLFLKARDGGETVVTPPRDVDPALTRTRLFQRLVDHPNIAKYEPMIRLAAKKRGLEPELVKAVIAVESGFDASAVSDKGAVGLMQVLPATGERYGVRADAKHTVDGKLADPKLNLEIGTHYLADLLAMFPDRRDLALAAYNAGEGAVTSRRNTIPPFPETQAYVRLVDQFHAFYRPQPTAKTDVRDRIRVTIPGRRNLPDPGAVLPTGAPPPVDASLVDRASDPLPVPSR